MCVMLRVLTFMAIDNAAVTILCFNLHLHL